MVDVILLTLAAFFPSDSLRTEVIDGKPYVVHQVDEKETLYSISRRYGATIQSILEQNPTADGGLEVGQILKVPFIGKVKTKPPVQTSDGLIHKVVAKETLFSIARLYNVSVDDIKAWNNLGEKSIYLGQDILIKKNPPTTAVTQKPSIAKTEVPRTHTVAAKETMFSIARQYGVTWQQVKEWNNLPTAELKIGQVIFVTAPVAGGTLTPEQTNSPVTTAPVIVKQDPTVSVTERVTGSDEIRETGIAELIEGSEGNRKYLAQHRTVKAGTILKIRNLTTNQEVFVRVTGPIIGNNPGTIIRISKSAYDRLGATEPNFKAEITYYK